VPHAARVMLARTRSDKRMYRFRFTVSPPREY
jgi:hypothetical protein